MWWRDRQFWFAMALGPAFWAGYVWIGGIPPSWSAPANWLGLVLAGLLSPVLEEWVFRGWIQGQLLPGRYRQACWAGLSVANLIASLLFVGLHFFFHPPLWAAGVLLPSLVFGYFRDRHNGVAASVALHVFYNMGYFWLIAGAA